MDRKKELLIRAYLVMLFFIVFAGVILYRVFNIAVVEGDKWRSEGVEHVQMRTIEADRGSIYADDLSLLATTLPFFDIHMDTKIVSNKVFHAELDSLCLGLAKLNPSKSFYEWKQILLKERKRGNRFLAIDRKVSTEEVMKYKSLPIFRLGQFKGGLILKRQSKREKPFGAFAARTIGEDRKNASKVGLEDYFDKFLRGPEKKRLMKQVSSSTWVPILDLEEHDVEKGNDLYTTLNINLQDLTHHALLKAIEKYEAKAGTAIVMEVETGAIKAISNLGRTKAGYLAETYNYAVGASSEPGSTFKLATVLALLEDGYADLSSPVDLEGGRKKFYKETMRDSKIHGIRQSNLQEAFEISSNVGIASLAFQHYGSKEGRLKYKNRLCEFGLCEKTNIEINGEGLPYIKDPVHDKKIWYGTTIPWMSHGYELHETPLQMLAMYNAVANDGRYMKPYLVSEIRGKFGAVKKFMPQVVRDQIASPQTIASAKELLQGVVQRGTAKNLRSNIVTMAGKTGTTVVGYEDKTKERRYNASFAGYFPADKPQYSIMVVIYEPKGKYYGSSVAAPVFKEIAEKYTMIEPHMQVNVIADNQRFNASLPGKVVGNKGDLAQIMNYIDLQFKDNSKSSWVEVDPYETRMLVDNKTIKKSLVPDVRGMGARDALYVLENLGYQVEMDGMGKVYKQSIPPGKENKGQEIRIFLN